MLATVTIYSTFCEQDSDYVIIKAMYNHTEFEVVDV